MLLDVSMCLSVVQRLWDQYQTEDSCVQKTCSRPTTSYNTCRRPFSSSFGTKEKNHYRAAARCRPLSSIRKKNLRYYGAKSSSQCRSVCKKTSCVRSLNGRQRRNRLCWAREHVSDAATMGFVLFTDESRFTMESDSGRSRSGGHTDLHVFHGGTVTGLRYRDEILDPYVRPYAAAIGNDFILMDDNARPHRAGIVEEYLENHGLNEWNGQLDLQT
ncbi:transposable element Tcb2 transposase [Trichonephila clavipes]|nr:transposable element Tcb2 transposase [Trichonephila clavipes]